VGKNPQGLAMSPDGKTAWVVCYDSDTLVPVITRTDTAGQAIRLPGGPSAIAVAARPSGATTGSASTKTRASSKTKKKT
jgi:DNA-binding beta-propeller fold protein YncE